LEVQCKELMPNQNFTLKQAIGFVKSIDDNNEEAFNALATNRNLDIFVKEIEEKQDSEAAVEMPLNVEVQSSICQFICKFIDHNEIDDLEELKDYFTDSVNDNNYLEVQCKKLMPNQNFTLKQAIDFVKSIEDNNQEAFNALKMGNQLKTSKDPTLDNPQNFWIGSQKEQKNIPNTNAIDTSSKANASI
jgi:hypothetical protein